VKSPLASKSIFEIDSIKTSQEYLIKMFIALINTSLLEKEIMKFNKMKILLETFISISK